MTDNVVEMTEAAGFTVLGGFPPGAGDAVPDVYDTTPARSLLLIANAGPGMFLRFARERDPDRDTLDAWCEDVLKPIAARAGMRAVFPWQRPYLPFQKWAMKAGAGRPSPLGMNIHPEYGLWYGFRAAFISAREIGATDRPPAGDHPCDSCSDKPCLSACPVDAFANGKSSPFNSAACVSYLNSQDGNLCLSTGCAARLACPVGKDHAYSQQQIRFHLSAFYRACTEQ